MAHRNMMLFKLPELAASTVQAGGEGAEAKDTLGERREGALKFMTRSVACMADGKGEHLAHGKEPH
jgi:cell cycle arrest protein BUB3